MKKIQLPYIPRSDNLNAAHDKCHLVYLYRKDFLSILRKIAIEVSKIPLDSRESDKFKTVIATLKQAEIDGGLRINIDKGTIYCIPFHKLIDSYLQKMR